MRVAQVQVAEDVRPLWVDYIKRDSGPFSMASSHYHHGYEIYYLVEGERYYFIKDRTYEIKAGDLVLIPPQVIHKTLSTDKPKHERLLINLEVQYLVPLLETLRPMGWYEGFYGETPVYKLPVEQQRFVQSHMLKMFHLQQASTPEADNLVDLMMMTFLMLLRDIRIEAESTKHTSHHRPIEEMNKTHRRMSEIAVYINEHYHEPLSLNSLSTTFYISPYYLSRTFKKATGFSLNEYINQVRILEAEKMLLDYQGSITAIAEHVGFESITHFGRMFKKLTGYSPSQYKKFRI